MSGTRTGTPCHMRGVRRRPLTSTGATDFDAFTRADPPQPSGFGAACTVPANPTDNTPAATAAATTFFTRNSFNQWSPAGPLPAAERPRVPLGVYRCTPRTQAPDAYAHEGHRALTRRGTGRIKNGPTGATTWRSECCHRAPGFGALGEPAFYRAVGVDVADETPCAAPLPRESPSGAQSLLVPLPVSGPRRDNHPRSQGRHLSSSSPRSGH